MTTDENTTSDELVLHGLSASPGWAMGGAYLYEKAQPIISRMSIERDRVPLHLERFKQARFTLKNEWQQLLKDSRDDKTKAIIEAQIAIINDPELRKQVEHHIKDKLCTVEFAIKKAFESYLSLLSGSDEQIVADRLIDVSDVRDRLIQLAVQHQNEDEVLPEGKILITKEISPRELIQLARENVRGIVTEFGGITSHAAIIARSIGIPFIMGVPHATAKIENDDRVLIDGERGRVILHPSKKHREHSRQQQAAQDRTLSEDQAICRKPSLTSDGHPFVLQANIEFPEELTQVKRYRAEGIGLLRTESLYLGDDELGLEDNQATFYDTILRKTGDAPVTIRLFDVGGDKFLSKQNKEQNPFLGWRGIRMLLDERDLLQQQLRAILQTAGRYPGRVKILAPMVSSVNEIHALRKEIDAQQEILSDQGKNVDLEVELGIMVEIPNVAVQADVFAREVDFFSIGTNDLTQYLLAVDRGNTLISGLYQQTHPAVWAMIERVACAAKKQQIETIVCGELASNPVAAACLLGLGVGHLSIAPIRIPVVKKCLIQHSFTGMKKLADNVLKCVSVEEISVLFEQWESDN